MIQRCFSFLPILLFFVLFSGASFAEEPDWSLYGNLLTTHVKQEQHHGVALSWVNYTELKKDPLWEQVTAQLDAFSTARLSGREEQLAFYINAYNILTMKFVSDNWPLESIKDVGSFFSPVWKRDAGKINGETVTLDQVEHKILRKMKEPRIHFAIVCASVSCPDLRREPYIAEKLDQQLEDQTNSFLRNAKKGLLLTEDQIRVSKIFSWFEEDFSSKGGVEGFLRQYRKLPKSYSLDSNLPYDWRVNGS